MKVPLFCKKNTPPLKTNHLPRGPHPRCTPNPTPGAACARVRARPWGSRGAARSRSGPQAPGAAALCRSWPSARAGSPGGSGSQTLRGKKRGGGGEERGGGGREGGGGVKTKLSGEKNEGKRARGGGGRSFAIHSGDESAPVRISPSSMFRERDRLGSEKASLLCAGKQVTRSWGLLLGSSFKGRPEIVVLFSHLCGISF